MQHKWSAGGDSNKTPLARRNAVKPRRNAWFTLSRDTLMLGIEAQSVIGLRLMKAAMGGEAAHWEATLMVAEKAKAIVDVQMMLARSALSGQAHLGANRALALYRRRVQANQRRLGKGG
jgi:hypothetical protein